MFPNGVTQTILRVPHYNWRWQLWYGLAEPVALPKGTKIECTAHFDNSANHPENPDPAKTVIWGQQGWDEMMVGYFNLVFDAKTPAKALFPERKGRSPKTDASLPEGNLPDWGAASRAPRRIVGKTNFFSSLRPRRDPSPSMDVQDSGKACNMKTLW